MDWTPGTFGWVDLVTTDVPAAKRFYAGMLGWTYEDRPTPVGVDYTMCYRDELMVCGMGPQPPAMQAAGAPPAWNSYVLVEDADETAAAAEAAGGGVVMPVMDVMDSGRMVMVAGPDGAVVGAWQPIEHEGAELFGEPGAVTWNELQSRDLVAARDFLSETFGWTWRRQAGELEYWVADAEESPEDVGGAMNMPDGVPLEAPSMWVVYFAVDDCYRSAVQVAELGGSLFLPPMVMGPGTFAGAVDPTGGMFFFGSFPEPV
jgi:predicted enzyme related to lactoylglutathione lyase